MIAVAIVAAVLAFGLAAAIGQSRRNLLTRLRAGWGRDVVRLRRFPLIHESHRARLLATEDSEAVDERTWRDLLLDDVFALLDRTESTLGQHALYHRLRCAHAIEQLESFDRLATHFETDPSSRERAQIALARLQDLNGYNLWWLKSRETLAVPGWYIVFPLLTTLALITGLVSAFQGFTPIIALPFVIDVIVGILMARRLTQMASAFRQIAPVIAAAQAVARVNGFHPTLDAIRRDAANLSVLKTLSRWISTNPLMLTLDAPVVLTLVNDFVNVVYGYINLALLLDGTVVWWGARRLREGAGSLLETIAALGDVDAAISIASFRAGAPEWIRPRLAADAGAMQLAEVRHPLVPNAVANTVNVAAGHGLVVTGANMAGKSTFLRTVGISAVLSQSVYTCLATYYEAPLVVVRSCIGRADDLLAGKSYYLAEVEALLELVKQSESQAPHLFLLDELFRGTNAVERLSAGEAVLDELLDQGKPHVVIAATHDTELVDLISANYAAFHFADSIGPDGLWFDYRLRPGATTSRNAIALLQMQGAPEALVQRAKRRAQLLAAERHV